MSTFFTSDLHLGHQNIIKYCSRPFGSVEEMNETLISNYNEMVSESDWVYFLGDICMGKIAETLPLVSRLNGKKVLIAGNHDRVFIGEKEKNKKRFAPLYNEQFFLTYNGTVIYDLEVDEHYSLYTALIGPPTLAPTQLVMNHFPPEGDSQEGDDRYVSLRPRNRPGNIHLCGHVHDAWKRKGNVINVGVDVWDFKPVPLEAITEIMREEGWV